MKNITGEDSKGNKVAVTLFESYLSKYLIEHQEFYHDIFLRILNAIEELNELNKNNNQYNRTLFSTFSVLRSEFPNYHDIDSLKNKFDIFPVVYYIKLFCEMMLKNEFITQFPGKEERKTVLSLSVLCQQNLFKTSRNKQLIKLLAPVALFSEKNRGVVRNKRNSLKVTRKLGIVTDRETPVELENYFSTTCESAQYEYTPDRNSNVGKWFTKYNLPIISGVSGSARDYLTYIFAIIKLEPSEIQLLTVAVAATLVAKGHHSYFEMMIILDRIGFKLQDSPDLYAFYAQTLPQIILSSDSYQEFKKSEHGAILLKDIIISNINETNSKELPSPRIG